MICNLLLRATLIVDERTPAHDRISHAVTIELAYQPAGECTTHSGARLSAALRVSDHSGEAVALRAVAPHTTKLVA